MLSSHIRNYVSSNETWGISSTFARSRQLMKWLVLVEPCLNLSLCGVWWFRQTSVGPSLVGGATCLGLRKMAFWCLLSANLVAKDTGEDWDGCGTIGDRCCLSLLVTRLRWRQLVSFEICSSTSPCSLTRPLRRDGSGLLLVGQKDKIVKE